MIKFLKNLIISEEIENDITEDYKLSEKEKKYLIGRWCVITKAVIKLKSEIKYSEINKIFEMEDSVQIQKFDGKNYEAWKMQLKAILTYKDCIKPLSTKEKPANIEADAWAKQEAKAKMTIITSINFNQMEYIKNLETPYDIITKLDSEYAAKSTTMQIIYMGKLSEIKLNQFKNNEDFFLQFEKLVNQYKSAGGEISEKEKIKYMVKALPIELNQIGILLDMVPAEKQNLVFLKEKIKEFSLTKEVKGERKTIIKQFLLQN